MNDPTSLLKATRRLYTRLQSGHTTSCSMQLNHGPAACMDKLYRQRTPLPRLRACVVLCLSCLLHPGRITALLFPYPRVRGHWELSYYHCKERFPDFAVPGA
ncbi:hypothetical protein BJX64DRAFT_252543 [Aspergillus heterothallicus]